MGRSRFAAGERDPQSQNTFKRFAGVKGKRKKAVASITIEGCGYSKVRPRFRRYLDSDFFDGSIGIY